MSCHNWLRFHSFRKCAADTSHHETVPRLALGHTSILIAGTADVSRILADDLSSRPRWSYLTVWGHFHPSLAEGGKHGRTEGISFTHLVKVP